MVGPENIDSNVHLAGLVNDFWSCKTDAGQRRPCIILFIM